MSSTNKTANYKLPQWSGTDHPTFKEDFNPAFSTIDSTMKNNADIASTANSTADQALAVANNVTVIKLNLENKTRMTCDDFDNLYVNAYNKADL